MGHLFRSLALARELEQRGARVLFITNNDPAARRILGDRPWRPREADDAEADARMIRELGIRAWINDRLDTTLAHAASVTGAGARLATFDDHGAGAELADLVILPLPAPPGQIARGKAALLGLRYAIIDPVIEQYRRERTRCESIVVSMGGSDTYGLTLFALRALRQRGLGATVILGPGFKEDSLLKEGGDDCFTFKKNVPSLIAEFARHDLAVTAGGITLCEAQAAGLPCVVVAAEAWEERTARHFDLAGSARYAGYREQADYSVLDRMPSIGDMSRAALKAIDCQGVRRVADALTSLV